ncbi:hypothetical protein B4064_1606 [Caldibacillus thermoamylovorans]|uniref:Uncharacterized protein n=1 Tax=Caldibacillus thermoamylovorans TaxID=35841 RepID=A0A0D0GF24_9BACI|nr:hypothetical protein B4065_3064 [Caldibacillus thermoamylovorans]KIO68822.1 hypothetical protein B4064_1606 [Caldibacillus thermoamylovorans]KIO69655.1 hypothetical protein B4166_1775 [Caldibacillus thermoamylovorans]KIO72896.1 hypothetical protein B4167_2672 [Caldibacillus thermoamylovorans]
METWFSLLSKCQKLMMILYLYFFADHLVKAFVLLWYLKYFIDFGLLLVA